MRRAEPVHLRLLSFSPIPPFQNKVGTQTSRQVSELRTLEADQEVRGRGGAARGGGLGWFGLCGRYL